MIKGLNPLSPMRRRAVDRLLIQYLELPESEQAAWLEEARRRRPHLAAWLERLLGGSHTVTLLDDSMRRLAGESIERIEFSVGHLNPGDRLGPWEIIAEVGRGGMGRVYQGRRADGAFEMEVAIKQIGRRRRGLAELLRRECRLLARLDHPAVTRLVDAGLDDQAGPFLVMEWVDGRDLADWLVQEKPGMESRIKVFEHIAEAVAHAHQRLIVHGDIKPNNIRIRDDGSIKLLDFGVARLLESSDTELAAPVALTPGFASPEQRAGEEITPASDIWSLGALLFWLLTQQKPPADARQIEPELSRQASKFSPELLSLIRKATATTPEQRYPSAATVLDELQRHRRHLPLRAMESSRSYRLRCFVRRHWAGLAGTALLLAVASAGVTSVLWQAKQTELEAERTVAASARAEAVKDFLLEMLAESDPYESPGEPATVRDLLQRSSETVGERFADQPEIAVELFTVIGLAKRGLHNRERAADLLEDALELSLSDAVPADDTMIANQEFLLAQMLEESERRRQLLASALNRIENDPDQYLMRAGILSFQAFSQFSAGSPRKAAELVNQAIGLACTERGLSDDAAYCRSILGDAYFYLNAADRQEEAQQVASRSYELALELHENTPHPDLINSGITYMNALIDGGRAAEAVTMAADLIELAEIGIGEDSAMVAYILFPLARAHAAMGKHEIAVEHWRRALDIVAEATPDSLGIPVQLNFMVDSLLALRKAEAAEQAYEHYVPIPWDNTPQHALNYRQINQLRLKQLQGGTIPDSRFEDLWPSFETIGGTTALRFAKLALDEAMRQDRENSSAKWKERIPGNPATPGAAWTLKARYWLMVDDRSQAEERIRDAQTAFKSRGENTGPRRAEWAAVKAELRCRQGAQTEGQELLVQAQRYWPDLPEQASKGFDARSLAPACGD